MKNTLDTKCKSKGRIYKQFDSASDEDALYYYWIIVKCKNCRHTTQIAIKKGRKVNSSRLKLLNCPRCELRGKLLQVEWDGHKYVRFNDC